MLRILVAAVLAAAAPLTALAAAVAESVKGDVQVNGAALARGGKVGAPTAVTTGPGAQVFLRLDDEMQIVLGENSLLRVVDFRFTSSGVTDRAVFELLRGSARVVTGQVALNSPRQFFFRVPQTQLTVERPADFSVALVNPAYISVNSGSVISSNGWGNVTLSAGSTSAIASNAAAPTVIPASAVPAGASASMRILAAAAVSAPPTGGAAAGVAGSVASGATTFGIPTPAVVVGAIVAGVGAAAAAENESAPSQPSTTTHH